MSVALGRPNHSMHQTLALRATAGDFESYTAQGGHRGITD